MDALPTEILRKIFSELSYFDLKLRIPLVCKRFRAILRIKSATGEIDELLFRDTPAANCGDAAIKSGDYEIHPILRPTTEGINTAAIRVNSLRMGGFMSDNAVSPAVTRLIVKLNSDGGRSIEVYAVGSVKVADIVRARRTLGRQQIDRFADNIRSSTLHPQSKTGLLGRCEDGRNTRWKASSYDAKK